MSFSSAVRSSLEGAILGCALPVAIYSYNKKVAIRSRDFAINFLAIAAFQQLTSLYLLGPVLGIASALKAKDEFKNKASLKDICQSALIASICLSSLCASGAIFGAISKGDRWEEGAIKGVEKMGYFFAGQVVAGAVGCLIASVRAN
ncbi:MAG: hypothetical protein WCG42_00190 [Parachlamydiaceae bacterium]